MRAFQQQSTLLPTPANNSSKQKEKQARKIEAADDIDDPHLFVLFLSVKAIDLAMKSSYRTMLVLGALHADKFLHVIVK